MLDMSTARRGPPGLAEGEQRRIDLPDPPRPAVQRELAELDEHLSTALPSEDGCRRRGLHHAAPTAGASMEMSQGTHHRAPTSALHRNLRNRYSPPQCMQVITGLAAPSPKPPSHEAGEDNGARPVPPHES